MRKDFAHLDGLIDLLVEVVLRDIEAEEIEAPDLGGIRGASEDSSAKHTPNPSPRN